AAHGFFQILVARDQSRRASPSPRQSYQWLGAKLTTAREAEQWAFGPIRIGLWSHTRRRGRASVPTAASEAEGAAVPRLGGCRNVGGLHFFEHEILIRTASRTGAAACRCEKLLH